MALALVLAGCGSSSKVAGTGNYTKSHVIGFYNLENLFDTYHDEGKNDYEYLPDGANQWTEVKYRKKLHNMASVIRAMKDENKVYHTILGVSEIEINALLLQGFVFLGMFEDFHQSQQGGQAHFVVFGGDAGLQVIERGLLPVLLHYFARHGHFDAEELVAFAILAFACLEEARQAFDLRRVLMGEDLVV